MSEPKAVDGISDRNPSTEEQLPGSAPELARAPWSSPTVTDLGAVSDVTKGISYNPTDGISNLTT